MLAKISLLRTPLVEVELGVAKIDMTSWTLKMLPIVPKMITCALNGFERMLSQV